MNFDHTDRFLVRSRGLRQALLVPVLAGMVGLAATSQYAAVALAALMLPILLATPQARLWLFVGGGMVVFASGGISVLKVGYLGLCLALAIFSVHRLRRIHEVPAGGLLATGALLLLTCQGVLVGYWRGAPIDYIVRDATTYVMIAVAIPIGLDVLHTASGSSKFTIYALPATSSMAFAVNILINRGETGEGVQRFAFGSMLVVLVGVSALICWSVRRSVNVLQLAGAALMVATVLASGTRTGLLLFAPLTIVALRGRIQSAVRAIIAAVSVTAIIAIMLIGLAPTFVSAEFLEQRYDATVSVLRGSLATDPSAQERGALYELGQKYASEYPVFGQGFGRVVPNPNGLVPDSFYLDTPWLYPAKFGWLGTGVLVVALLFLYRLCLREGRRCNEESETFVRMVAWTTLLIVPFGAVTEDKGFGWMVALTLSALPLFGRQVGQEQTSSRRSPFNGRRALV